MLSTSSPNRSSRYGSGEPIGEKVDQATAYRVFAGRDDLGHMRVAGGGHLRLHLVGVEPFALLDEEGPCRQPGRRRHAVKRGAGRQQRMSQSPRITV